MNLVWIIPILIIAVLLCLIGYRLHEYHVLSLYEDITIAIDEYATEMEAQGHELKEVNDFQLWALQEVVPLEYGVANMAIWSHKKLMSEQLYTLVGKYL